MPQLMSWLNVMAGLILFFAMSGISEWVIFSSPQAKLFPFIVAILLLVNAVYLALSRGESWARR